jgi:hypothetical protein
LNKVKSKLNNMDSACDGTNGPGSENNTGSNSIVLNQDILRLTKQGGPNPPYDQPQSVVRASLAKVSNRLLALIGTPGTGKTWPYINLLSELLHENEF